MTWMTILRSSSFLSKNRKNKLTNRTPKKLRKQKLLIKCKYLRKSKKSPPKNNKNLNNPKNLN